MQSIAQDWLFLPNGLELEAESPVKAARYVLWEILAHM